MVEWLARSRVEIETLVAALAGIVVFHALNMPAATLSGAMVGVALLLGAGREARLGDKLRDLGMLLGGVTMGSSVTPEMLQGFQRYPASIFIFCCCIAATMLVLTVFFRRVAGWDKATAFFASAPGALTSVIAVAADTRADLLKVTMAQSLRLFMLVAVLPLVVSAAGSTGAPLPRGVADAPSLALMLAGGAALSFILARSGMAAPWIFGGMVASAALHATSLVSGDPPRWLMETGFGLVGIFIGTRFSQITRQLLVSSLATSVGAFCLGLAVACVFAFLASLAVGVPFGQALVAYAPGGLEAMIILGAALGLDPIYVGLHHLVRFFGIGLLIPFAATWLGRE
jgi:uncharacterized protein